MVLEYKSMSFQDLPMCSAIKHNLLQLFYSGRPVDNNNNLHLGAVRRRVNDLENDSAARRRRVDTAQFDIQAMAAEMSKGFAQMQRSMEARDAALLTKVTELLTTRDNALIAAVDEKIKAQMGTLNNGKLDKLITDLC